MENNSFWRKIRLSLPHIFESKVHKLILLFKHNLDNIICFKHMKWSLHCIANSLIN